jgi:hypothetical protein
MMQQWIIKDKSIIEVLRAAGMQVELNRGESLLSEPKRYDTDCPIAWNVAKASELVHSQEKGVTAKPFLVHSESV